MLQVSAQLRELQQSMAAHQRMAEEATETLQHKEQEICDLQAHFETEIQTLRQNVSHLRVYVLLAAPSG